MKEPSSCESMSSEVEKKVISYIIVDLHNNKSNEEKKIRT